MEYIYGIRTEAEVLEAEVTTLLSLASWIEEDCINFQRTYNGFSEEAVLETGDTLHYQIQVIEFGRVIVKVRVTIEGDAQERTETLDLGMEEGRLNTYKGKDIIVDHIRETSRDFVWNWKINQRKGEQL